MQKMQKLFHNPLFSVGFGVSLAIVALLALNVLRLSPIALIHKALAGAGITGTGTLNALAAFSGSDTIGNSIIYDDGIGHVSIGATNPGGGSLEVYRSGLGLSLSQASANDIYMRYHVPGVRFWMVGAKANGDFWFSNDGVGDLSKSDPLTLPLTLTGAGNVGIGTANPAKKLDVNGSVRLNDTLYFHDVSDTVDQQFGFLNNGGVMTVRPLDNNFNVQSPGLILTLTPSGDLLVPGYMSTPTLCLGADCRSVWPNLQEVTERGDTTNHTVTVNDVCTSGGKCLSSVGGGGTQNLQQVTDQGDTTNHTVTVNDVCTSGGKCLSSVGGGGIDTAALANAFGQMHMVAGNPVNAPSSAAKTSFATCPGDEIRVACSTGQTDDPITVIIDSNGAQGCKATLAHTTNAWAVAQCIPRP